MNLALKWYFSSNSARQSNSKHYDK